MEISKTVRYSQNNEQELIENYFGHDFVGTFADIGCNDGVTLSNTYALVQKGWSGLMVEASFRAFERAVQNIWPYINNISIKNVAAGTYDGEVEFYESGELLGKGDISLVSSTKTEELKRWESIKMPFEKITVPIKTWQSILDSTMQKKYDLFSIDIEGGEREVVPQIDFAALGTKMAIIEWNGKDAEFYDGIMFKFGFKILSVNPENRIYVL